MATYHILPFLGRGPSQIGSPPDQVVPSIPPLIASVTRTVGNPPRFRRFRHSGRWQPAAFPSLSSLASFLRHSRRFFVTRVVVVESRRLRLASSNRVGLVAYVVALVVSHVVAHFVALVVAHVVAHVVALVVEVA